MKKAQVIYQQDNRRWVVIARDPGRPEHVIDTNEYLVSDEGEFLLTDPGGSEIFPAVFAALSTVTDPMRIQWLFASHQDPDIISSLGLWLDCNPQLKCYVSWLWGGFIPHFGGDAESLLAIPDEGMAIPFGRRPLQAVPAHFLHSPGNFHLYDPVARILFSGDVGAALPPPDEGELFVSQFDRHIRHAEGFHRRWMGSNEARLAWCERASQMPIDMLCPQHGAIYRGDDVMRFINWFSELEVGHGQLVR
ncbi:MBL fold metallo-hydrolase [Chromobacterium sp. IIBBL 290-4]|uniref:MBL fold metallo-hydrolase n=1 Tax=Chromobacterium sp. IIBBL 290-4 TaxID=2953890 RepID=UPI0020B6B456|nr:MBL fold metallo-hydrolase [Chromobacterium sp. IIBBL 290-4]UTH75532.1 FprA family A-type flavoprotein [Chromobacterium sp. IIBBL 290-4]